MLQFIFDISMLICVTDMGQWTHFLEKKSNFYFRSYRQQIVYYLLQDQFCNKPHNHYLSGSKYSSMQICSMKYNNFICMQQYLSSWIWYFGIFHELIRIISNTRIWICNFIAHTDDLLLHQQHNIPQKKTWEELIFAIFVFKGKVRD